MIPRHAVWSLIAQVVLALPLLSSCSSSTSPRQPQITSTSSTVNGGIRITDEMIGRQRGTMTITRSATNPNYGYSEKSPVLIGGGFDSGSDRTYKFLNSLRGPNGDAINYDRVGTCCSFKTAKSPFGEGLLEVYEIKVVNESKSRQLYFNWYDEGEVFVPAGLTGTR